MDRSIDRNINQLHPSKILDEMGISWNDNLETKTSKLYQKVSTIFSAYQISIYKYKYKNIKCINVECKKSPSIKYIKYDFENMKFMYICNHCGETWTNNI